MRCLTTCARGSLGLNEEERDRQNYIAVVEKQPSIAGRYVDVQRICPRAGSGAYSLVFKAHDLMTNKPVALKFYNPLRTGDDYRKSCFDRESRILERLRGQRDILQLLEPKSELVLQLVDNATGMKIPVTLPFLVTDLARSNVKEHIYQADKLPLASLTIFRGMCRAVQRIHRKEICHRDLKPDNFFLLRLGGLCLGDFGSARLLDGSEPPLMPNYYFWRGDRRYTAPEMFAALDRDVQLFYHADMFSLGATLFEMFTKHNLVTLIFDASFHRDLLEHFQLIQPDRRLSIYSELASSLAQRRQLPDIDDFGVPIPQCIRERLNRLYKGLANLDYRHRICGFDIVFTEIQRCVDILGNEAKYRRLMEIKGKWEDRRKQLKRTK